MKTMSAKDAEERFDVFIDTAQQEPVVVVKNDYPVGVFLSIGHLEDTIWGERAKAAHAEGYLRVRINNLRPYFIVCFQPVEFLAIRRIMKRYVASCAHAGEISRLRS